MRTTNKNFVLYVAFSVHGTCCFISASKRIHGDNKEFYLDQLNKAGFVVAYSRRPNRLTNEIKLHWNKLTTKKGEPYINPSWILRRFNELEVNHGFIVDKTSRENFVKTHFKKV